LRILQQAQKQLDSGQLSISSSEDRGLSGEVAKAEGRVVTP
jgi:hypothetical protein